MQGVVDRKGMYLFIYLFLLNFFLQTHAEGGGLKWSPQGTTNPSLLPSFFFPHHSDHMNQENLDDVISHTL